MKQVILLTILFATTAAQAQVTTLKVQPSRSEFVMPAPIEHNSIRPMDLSAKLTNRIHFWVAGEMRYFDCQEIREEDDRFIGIIHYTNGTTSECVVLKTQHRYNSKLRATAR